MYKYKQRHRNAGCACNVSCWPWKGRRTGGSLKRVRDGFGKKTCVQKAPDESCCRMPGCSGSLLCFLIFGPGRKRPDSALNCAVVFCCTPLFGRLVPWCLHFYHFLIYLHQYFWVRRYVLQNRSSGTLIHPHRCGGEKNIFGSQGGPVPSLPASSMGFPTAPRPQRSTLWTGWVRWGKGLPSGAPCLNQTDSISYPQQVISLVREGYGGYGL